MIEFRIKNIKTQAVFFAKALSFIRANEHRVDLGGANI